MFLEEPTRERTTVDIMERNKYALRIFHLSKYFFIFPYRLKEGYFIISVPFSILSVVISFFILLLLDESSGVRILSDGKFGLGGPPLESMVRKWFYISLTCMYFASLVTSFFRVSSINRIIQALDGIDCILSLTVFGTGFDLQTPFRLKNFLGGAICVALALIGPWQGNADVIYNVYIILLAACTWLTGSQFAALGYLVSNRFEEACSILQDLHLYSHYKMRARKAAKLSAVHDKLCEVCAVLDSSFTILLTMLISACFLCITFGSFFVLHFQPPPGGPKCRSFIRRTTDLQSATTMLRMFSIILALVTVWQISACASDISKKAKEFNRLLYGCMIDDKYDDISRNKKLRLHISMGRDVTFTACGFFNLNYTLIHSILAAATTYLVILMQLGQQSDKNLPPRIFNSSCEIQNTTNTSCLC